MQNDILLFCPFCNELTEKQEVKNTMSKHPFRYVCPSCGAAVDADIDGNPLGLPAKSEIRYLRQQAHKSFNALLDSTKLDVKTGYIWLSKALKIKSSDTHFSVMSDFELERSIKLCNYYIKHKDAFFRTLKINKLL